MKNLMFLFFLLVFISQNANAGILFIEDFEDGPSWDYSNNFDLSSEYLADEWDIVSTDARSGNYSAQSKDAGSLVWAEDSCFHFSLNSNEVFVKFWIKISPGINNYNTKTNFMRFGTGGPGDWNDGGEFDAQDNWMYIYSDKVRSPNINLSIDGQWHEYAFYMNFTNGIWRAWKNANGDYSVSNSIVNYTDVTYAKPFTHILLPWYFKSDPGNDLFWIDDIEVWDQMPNTDNSIDILPPKLHEPINN